MTYTNEQQKDHRLQLADYLETVPDENYNHINYIACALGHAAMQGIGGLRNVDNFPMFKDHDSVDSAELIFGKGSYDTIFDTMSFIKYESRFRKSTRLEVIEALRDFGNGGVW